MKKIVFTFAFILVLTSCKKITGITQWTGTPYPGNIKMVEYGFWGSSFLLFSYNSDGLVTKIEKSNSNKEKDITDWCEFDWRIDSLILKMSDKTFRFKRDSEGYVLPIIGDTSWNWTYDSLHQITSLTSINYQKISIVDYYTWEEGEIKTFNGQNTFFNENLDKRNYGIKYFPAFMLKIVDPGDYNLQSKKINTGIQKPHFDDQGRISKCNQGDDFFKFFYYLD